MFKSITYLNYTYDSETQKYIYHYHLVDSDFECDILSVERVVAAWDATTAAVAEYHKRNLDVVKNLYLFNLYLQKTWYNTWSFMNILDYQNKYVDKYCPINGINFSKDIYPGVKELYETLNQYV